MWRRSTETPAQRLQPVVNPAEMARSGVADFGRCRLPFCIGIAGKGHAGRLGIVRRRAAHRFFFLRSAGNTEMRQHRRPYRVRKLAIVEDKAAADVAMVENGAE